MMNYEILWILMNFHDLTSFYVTGMMVIQGISPIACLISGYFHGGEL